MIATRHLPTSTMQMFVDREGEIMRRYWLMDQHGGDGPTALVETDGSMHIVSVLKFGPTLTSLDDQQGVLDKVMGRVAPTMKPLVDAASIDEEGVDPHPDLRGGSSGNGPPSRAARGEAGGRGLSGGRPGGGPSRKGSRGDR